MASIEVDGVLVSIGQAFKCPTCMMFKKTIELLARVPSGIFKTSDIVCSNCFDKITKENSIEMLKFR